MVSAVVQPSELQQTMDLASTLSRHFFKITATRVAQKQAVKITIDCTTRMGVYRAWFLVDDVWLAHRANPGQSIHDQTWVTCLRLLVTMGDSVTGKYPLTRLYADMSLKQRLLMRPDQKIPGWVFPKYADKIKNGAPEEGSLQPLKNVEMVDNSTGVPLKPAPSFDDEDALDDDELEERLAKSIFDATVRNQAEDLRKVAKSAKRTVTRKKRVATSPPHINPNKVKKMHCPVHTSTEMEFSPVKQKWKCPRPDCKMSARPVKDEDDRSVQIGKGDTSLRIVVDQSDITVLLLSDDNLALNITPFIDVNEFIIANGLVELAEQAKKNDRDEFVDTTERPLLLNLRVGVIGADALTQLEL